MLKSSQAAFAALQAVVPAPPCGSPLSGLARGAELWPPSQPRAGLLRLAVSGETPQVVAITAPSAWEGVPRLGSDIADDVRKRECNRPLPCCWPRGPLSAMRISAADLVAVQRSGDQPLQQISQSCRLTPADVLAYGIRYGLGVHWPHTSPQSAPGCGYDDMLAAPVSLAGLPLDIAMLF